MAHHLVGFLGEDVAALFSDDHLKHAFLGLVATEQVAYPVGGQQFRVVRRKAFVALPYLDLG